MSVVTVIKNAIKPMAHTRAFPAVPPSPAWRCSLSAVECRIRRSPAIWDESYVMGDVHEQDLGTGAGDATAGGAQQTSGLQSRLCEQLLKQINYEYTVTEHAYYCIHHPVHASEDVGHGRLDLSPPHLRGIELRSVAWNVHNLDCSVRIGNVYRHSLVCEGSGAVGYDPYLMTSTDILYKIHVSAHLQVFAELRVQSASLRRPLEVYGLLGMVGVDSILPALPPEPLARRGLVQRRSSVDGWPGVASLFPSSDYVPRLFYELCLLLGRDAIVGCGPRLSNRKSTPVSQPHGGSPTVRRTEPFQYVLGYHLGAPAAAPKPILTWRFIKIPPYGTPVLQALRTWPAWILTVVHTLHTTAFYLAQTSREGVQITPRDFGCRLSQHNNLKPILGLTGALAFVHLFQYRQWHVGLAFLPFLHLHYSGHGGPGDVWDLHLLAYGMLLQFL